MPPIDEADDLCQERSTVELVAHPSDGEKTAWVSWVGLDLLPEPTDVYIHSARIAGIVIAPDFVQELLSGEDLALVLRQENQKVELLAVQVERGAAQGCLVAGQVNLQVTDAEHGDLWPWGWGHRRRRNIALTRAMSSLMLKGLVM